MITHLEDQSKSGFARRPYTLVVAWRIITLCDLDSHQIPKGHTLTITKIDSTCPACEAIAAERKVKP